MPALMFFILWQKIKADAEEEVRLHSWCAALWGAVRPDCLVRSQVFREMF